MLREKTFFLFIICLGLVITLILNNSVNAGLANTAWPMLAHDVFHTGRSSNLGPQTNNLKWQVYVGNTRQGGAPVIGIDGTIFVNGGYSYGKQLFAINPQDGSFKWNVPFEFVNLGLNIMAVGDDGTIFVGETNDNPYANTFFYAINPADGSVKWQTEIYGSTTSGPVIDAYERIFFATGYTHTLYALDQETGDILWSKNSISGQFGSHPVLGTDVLYIGNNNGNLYAINPADGSVLPNWPVTLSGKVHAPSIGTDGMIYVGTHSGGHNFYKISPSGTIIWTYPLPQNFLGPAAFGSDGTIYLGQGNTGGNTYLIALDPNGTDAESILKCQKYMWGNGILPPVIGSDGTLYLTSTDSASTDVIAVCPCTYKNDPMPYKWPPYSSGSISSHMGAIGVDATLYVCGYEDSQGYLFAFGPAYNCPEPNAGLNMTITSEDQFQEPCVISGTATDIDNDPLQYRWREGSTILQDWQNVGPGGEADLNLCEIAPLNTGEHYLILEVDDGTCNPPAEDYPEDQMILTVNNSAPHCSVTGGGTYCPSASVELGGQISDYDGDTIAYRWLEGTTELFSGEINPDFGGDPVDLPYHTVSDLGVGTHDLSLEITDGINGLITCSVIVIMEECGIHPETNKGIIWPPNHQMVDIVINANAYGDPELSVAVSSNEPIEGLGDGDMTPDWVILDVDQMTDTINLQLRAERSGSGNGRIYSVTIMAEYSPSSIITETLNIIVPHDKRSH